LKLRSDDATLSRSEVLDDEVEVEGDVVVEVEVEGDVAVEVEVEVVVEVKVEVEVEVGVEDPLRLN
jgi:hypothetical protein